MPMSKHTESQYQTSCGVGKEADSTVVAQLCRNVCICVVACFGLAVGCANSTAVSVDAGSSSTSANVDAVDHLTAVSVDTGNLPTRLLGISDFQYAGAFALPDDTYGDSSANFAAGVIEVNGDSLFFVGHDHDDAIAEFVVPPLVNSRSIADLRYAKSPRQAFTKVIEKVSGGNREALDQIVGLELVNGRLIGNAVEYLSLIHISEPTRPY